MPCCRPRAAKARAFAPSGRVVTEDLWESALEVALDDTADYGLDALRDFSLERWLSAKVHAEGNTDQRARLEEQGRARLRV